MFLQEGSGDADNALNAARGTSRLEIHRGNLLPLGNLEDLVGTFDKLRCDVNTRPGDDLGRSGEDGAAIAADEFGWLARCGKASKLLGAERDPG